MDRNLTILLWKKSRFSIVLAKNVREKINHYIVCLCIFWTGAETFFGSDCETYRQSITSFIYLQSKNKFFWRKKHLAILTTMKVLHSWVIMPLLNLPFIMNYTSVCSEVIMLFLQREHSPPNCRLDYYSKEWRMKKLSFI